MWGASNACEIGFSSCLLNSGDVKQVKGLPGENPPRGWRGKHLRWGGLFIDGVGFQFHYWQNNEKDLL